MDGAVRVELQPAYVLHGRPYRETSLLLEAFTRDHGRVGLIAKGARRPKSRLRGLLQPFHPLLLSFSGRGELGLVTGADTDWKEPLLAGRSLMHGLYLNELLMRLLHRHDPHPGLFDTYRAALAGLASPGAAEPVLRHFEKDLLDAVGYGLTLDHEADSNRPIEPGRTYRYRPDYGPVAVAAEDRADPGGVLVSGATLVALGSGCVAGEACLREAKRLMRAVLETHLGGRPLMSRTLFVAPGRRHGNRAGPPATDGASD